MSICTIFKSNIHAIMRGPHNLSNYGWYVKFYGVPEHFGNLARYIKYISLASYIMI